MKDARGAADALRALQQERAVQSVLDCNEVSARYGLSLTEAQAKALEQCRQETLRANGRVEWNGGALPQIIWTFCDSAYIQQQDYVETLEALQDIFYYFKNESLDELGDEELLCAMRAIWEGGAQGSLEYLRETALEELCRAVRRGERR